MSFKRFFCPDSIAVVGAARSKGKVGRTIFDNIINSGYRGKVFPVNPKANDIDGHRCYPSILDIDQEIQLAVIVIPAEYIPEVLEECAEKGVKFIIIISSGFKETGVEGAKREKRLIEKANCYNMRILGPNCLGMMDTGCPLNATFSSNMPFRGRISFISQSGALLTSVLDWAKASKIGFSKVVSLGNKSDISENDLFEAWVEDENTDVITAYIEGISTGKDFIRVASRVSKEKPIIIIKSGNTDAGARAVSSHTGTLAGSNKAYDAAFKQAGIIRAKDIKELFNYSVAFSYQPLPRGRNIAIITNAGGPGIMATDECENRGIRLASFTVDTIERLKGFLPAAANIYNPVDVLGDALSERYKKALEAVMADKNVDAVLVLLTPQAMTEDLKTAEAIAEIIKGNKNKIPVMTSFMGVNEVREGIDYLTEKKIPNFEIPEDAIETLSMMMDYYEWKLEKVQPSVEFDVNPEKVKEVFKSCVARGRLELCELEARKILEAYRIPVPKAEVAEDIAGAKEEAERIGYPVVLKIVSPNILHKTDVGGIKIGVNDEKELEESFDQIMINVKRYMPEARISGILVQEMVRDKKETIIGISEDPQFGHVIMFGLGGIYVEVLKDVAFRIVPINRKMATEMISEIKTIRLLEGTRGEGPSDIDSIIDILLRTSQLVTDFPEIIEMDINPLFVKKKGEGSIAGDARIRIGG